MTVDLVSWWQIDDRIITIEQIIKVKLRVITHIKIGDIKIIEQKKSNH